MVETDALEPQQEPLELVLPGKDALHRAEAFLEDCFVVKPVPATLCTRFLFFLPS